MIGTLTLPGAGIVHGGETHIVAVQSLVGSSANETSTGTLPLLMIISVSVAGCGGIATGANSLPIELGTWIPAPPPIAVQLAVAVAVKVPECTVNSAAPGIPSIGVQASWIGVGSGTAPGANEHDCVAHVGETNRNTGMPPFIRSIAVSSVAEPLPKAIPIPPNDVSIPAEPTRLNWLGMIAIASHEPEPEPKVAIHAAKLETT